MNKISPIEARKALIAREQVLSNLVDDLMSYQQDLLFETNPLSFVLGDRRVGKSRTLATLLYWTALQYPNTDSLYLGLTRHTTQQIMLRPMNEIKTKHKLKATYNYERNMIEMSNGSKIFFRGADANEYELSKVLGSKLQLALFDEAPHYQRVNTYDAVYSKVLPASSDSEGARVVLAGTCSDIHRGLCFDVSTGSATCTGQPIKGWSYYEWSWRQNTIKLKELTRMHDKMIEDNPLIIHTPNYLRDWCHQWVIEDTAKIYRFDPLLNTIAALPDDPKKYVYILGIDLGWTAFTTFTVVAWSPHDPVLYVVECSRFQSFTADDASAMAEKLHTKYQFIELVVDDGGGGKQVSETMKGRYPRLPWRSAEKTAKRSNIEFMNSDFLTGKIKLLPNTKPLQEEYKTLIWDHTLKLAGKFEPDKRFSKDCSDGALYAFRHSRHYANTTPEPPKPQFGTQDYEEARINAIIDQNTREYEKTRDQRYKFLGKPMIDNTYALGSNYSVFKGRKY
jgi:hypothetical protein